MNKNLLLAVVASALILPWTGCKKSEKTAVLGPLPTGAAELKLQWPENERFVHHFDIKQKGEITVPGLPEPIKQDMNMDRTLALSVQKGHEDGTRQIELKLTSMSLRVRQRDQTMLDFDSSKRAGSDPLSEALSKTTGMKVELTLDASNRVESVQGADEFYNQLMSMSGRDQTGAAQSLSSLFSDQFFKEVFDPTASMPAKAVAPGDSWPVHREIEMGQIGMMIISGTNTLTGWEVHEHHNCAHLTFEGTIAQGSAGAALPTGVAVSLKDGTDSGDSWFDIDRGLFINSVITQDMNLVITVPNGGGGRRNAAGAPQTLQMAMNQIITMRLDPAD